MIPVDLLEMIRKALKVSDSVLTFRPAILTSQGTKGQMSIQIQKSGAQNKVLNQPIGDIVMLIN